MPRIFELLASRPLVSLGSGGAIVLLVVGLFGFLTAAWGYALFLSAGGLWGITIILAGIYVFTTAFETTRLEQASKVVFLSGVWLYVYCIAAFSGFFTHEALVGRVELRWIIFGPAILGALLFLEYGIYKLLVTKNRPTLERYRQFIARENVDTGAMRTTLANEIIIHKTLFSISFIRWLRHTLIFWGFVLLVVLELFAVFFREAVPAFGFRDIWEIQGHPIPTTFGFFYDLFGLLIVIGCVISLGWRIAAQGTEDQKYSDPPTVIFLLFVMLTGFLVEGLRISSIPLDQPYLSAEFVGYGLAILIGNRSETLMPMYDSLWYIHVLGSCLFIAYVPARRLIHSCATPLGRLMNSQKQMLLAKRRYVFSGLFGAKKN